MSAPVTDKHRKLPTCKGCGEVCMHCDESAGDEYTAAIADAEARGRTNGIKECIAALQTQANKFELAGEGNQYAADVFRLAAKDTLIPLLK